jgi:imidazole glycerol-phosphate synthase subunit HisH
MIAIIDYGFGNLRSVEKAFIAVGVEAVISSDKALLESASSLVLPGVGAFGDAMASLRAQGFDRIVIEAAQAGKPILGICLGYQLLFDEGEEFGLHRGLGLLPGRVVRFPESDLRVPHVGWNQVRRHRPHPIFNDLVEDPFFYFVHSFYVKPAPEHLIGATDYGLEFASIAGRDNIVGVQFHPEKSQQAGLQLLKNFANWSEG